MSKTEKALAALAVIDFIGAILAGLFGQSLASIGMIIALPLFWAVWITIEVVLLGKSVSALREETPPQAEAHKPAPEGCRRHLTDPSWISPARIRSDFLDWDQCTLMMWVLVPTRGQSLRDAPNNRYLLAHHTDPTKHCNQFALRYSSSNHWEVLFSNSRAQLNKLSIADGLDCGWHHFLIAWDRTSPNLAFVIDREIGGSDRSQAYLPHWPEHLNDNVTVGAWVSADETSYCETSLFELWILHRFLGPADPVVRDHFDLIKQIPS
jgi:hypothetical protein